MCKSVLKWIGGKYHNRDIYTRLIPDHTVFVSPFCGACHVELNKVPSKIEVVNDIDDRLVNFLCVSQTRPKELIELIETLPYSETLYNTFKKQGKHKEMLQDAAIFYYMNTAGYNAGGNRYKTGFSTSKTINKAEQFHRKIERIEIMAIRMKHWQILNRDFRNVIETFDSKETVFFVDPPYIDKEYLYGGNFTMKDHEDLAKILNEVEGKVILCYYPNPILDKLYSNWERITYSTVSQMQHGKLRPAKEELILLNFQPPQQLQLKI